MNPTKIEWADYTWNWFVGCTTQCSYCYARKMAKRQKHNCLKCYEFTPHIHPERLWEPNKIKHPVAIFAGSMGDPVNLTLEQWNQFTEVIQLTPMHTYIILTKSPSWPGWKPRFFPDNLWVGVSVTRQEDLWRIRDLKANMSAGNRKVVSFEPLHGHIETGTLLEGIPGIIIGPETGHGPKVIPQYEWIEALVSQAKAQGVKVFMKDALRPYVIGANFGEWRRELPWPVHKHLTRGM